MSLLKQLMIAKYHPTSEYLYTEAKKQFFLLKKYYYAVDLQSNKFSAKWMYFPNFSQKAAYITS